MKLAQAEILSSETGEPPVILLDDVMGELDISRQKLVNEIISGMQVFITSCSAESVSAGNEASLYVMKNGVLSPA
jgi:DNA replication and repair protein RecF